MQMTMSDFCMTPINNTIPLIPPGTNQQVIEYYLTCSGTNPFEDDIQEAYNATALLKASVDTLLSTSCPGNQDLLYVRGNISIINLYLDNITAISDCPPYQEQSDKMLNNAICYQLFIGTYITWICQYVISMGIFFLLITSSTIYYYFGRYWGMEKEDVDNIVASLEEKNTGDPGEVNQNIGNATQRNYFDVHKNAITYGDEQGQRSPYHSYDEEATSSPMTSPTAAKNNLAFSQSNSTDSSTQNPLATENAITDTYSMGGLTPPGAGIGMTPLSPRESESSKRSRSNASNSADRGNGD